MSSEAVEGGNIDTARFMGAMNLENPSEKQRLHNQAETKDFFIEESVEIGPKVRNGVSVFIFPAINVEEVKNADTGTQVN